MGVVNRNGGKVGSTQTGEKGRMPIRRTAKITSEQREELMQLCREYGDLQKKAVEIRWALNDQVAVLAGLVQRDEVSNSAIMPT